MNILVAVDLSPASDTIVEAARGVAELTGVTVYILHVVETEPGFTCPEKDRAAAQIWIATVVFGQNSDMSTKS